LDFDVRGQRTGVVWRGSKEGDIGPSLNGREYQREKSGWSLSEGCQGQAADVARELEAVTGRPA